jgi:hypothetical protein
MNDGSTILQPASTVGELTSMDLTSHVTIANLEMLAAVSSASMLVSSKVDQWLSGISQSEEGVVLLYVLILPLLFLPLLPIPIQSPRPGICPHLPQLLYLSSLTLSQLTPLISSHMLPLNLSDLIALCDHGPMICIVLPSFTHTIQTLMIGSST